MGRKRTLGVLLIARLPPGWPPPLETFARGRRRVFARLVARSVK